jgi:type VI secretion system protein ImpB
MDIDGQGLPIRELPFVLGVMGDFSGDSAVPRKPLDERRFIDIDRDKFNNVMAQMKPALHARVANVMTEDAETEIPVDVTFNSIEDFQPGRIVEQIPALKTLLEARNKLKQLANVIDRSKGGERILEDILQSADKLAKLRQEVSKAEAPKSDKA